MRFGISRIFLPQSADVLAMLHGQALTTQRGMEAFTAWASGLNAAGMEVREIEHTADEQKRELARALVAAFSTPIDSEDIFSLSHNLDLILDLAKDTVREAEVLHASPDADTAAMATELTAAVIELVAAIADLHSPDATGHADEARRRAREIERLYRNAVGHALEETDVRAMFSRRELYRQFGRIAEMVLSVSERVWYVVVKEA